MTEQWQLSIILEFVIRLTGEPSPYFTEEEKSSCLKGKTYAVRDLIFSSFVASVTMRVTLLAAIKQTELNVIQSLKHKLLPDWIA